MVEKQKQEVEWYDNPGLIITILLGLTLCIIILSQAFAIKNNFSNGEILRNIFTHNSIYIVLLVYSIFLKTTTGKKYFNFLNVFVIIFYSLLTIASLLTVFQSFGVSSLIYLILNIIILLYLVGTFLRETNLWNELELGKVPFDEVTNDWYFYAIVILASIYLAVNLYAASTFDGVVLSTLETVCIILFSRYIYLYKVYLEKKKEKQKEVKKD